MKKKEMKTLLFAIALSLAAATSANAGLAVNYSTPNDLPDLSHLVVLYSTPNDLPDPLNSEYFTVALSPNKKIISETPTFTKALDWTKKRDDRLFINQGVGNNLAIQSILMSNRLGSLSGKSQNFNAVTDFGKLGFRNMLDVYAETTPGKGQADLEFEIDPDINNLGYNLRPVIDTENLTPSYHHAP